MESTKGSVPPAWRLREVRRLNQHESHWGKKKKSAKVVWKRPYLVV